VKNVQSTEINCVFKNLLLNMAINIENIDLYSIVGSVSDI
jgi:hypothetical protein